MLSVYPYASGSLYIAGRAVTASFAGTVRFISNVPSASLAQTVLNPESGSRGKGVCLLTTEQYTILSSNPDSIEICNFT